jgi:hypothetical protein
MEDLLYFIQKNPWVAFIIAFWILRRIFGGGEKSKQQKAELAARRQAAREKNQAKTEQVKASRKGGALSGEGILAQIQRQIEEATQQAENAARGQIGSSEAVSMSRPEARMSGPTDAENTETKRINDLFAEQTAAMARPVEDSPVDYDTVPTGFEYRSVSDRKLPTKSDDAQWHMTKQGSTLDAFAFNPAINEPEDVAYHMKRRNYVSAARIDAPRVSVRDDRQPSEQVIVNDLLSSADSVTRAFILQEVLGPPRSMRPPGPNRMRRR